MWLGGLPKFDQSLTFGFRSNESYIICSIKCILIVVTPLLLSHKVIGKYLVANLSLLNEFHNLFTILTR